jgi:predicted dehydrogenase
VATARALIVGTGYAGARHADALRELRISFDGPVSARDLSRDLDAIARSPARVVHVCSANDLHAPLVSAALASGKDVVCEKPLALDVATAEDLARRADASGRLAVLGYGYRFHPLAVELAARARSGEIGAIHDVRGNFLQDWLLLATDENWRLDATRGGASRVVADIGSHWIDLAERATGQQAVAVVAHLGRLHGRATEDHAALLIRFDGGLAGTVVLSQAAAGHRNDLEISVDGGNGSLTWRYERPNEIVLGTRDGSVVIGRGDVAREEARRLAALPAGANEGRRNLLAAFYARLDDPDEGVLPLPSFRDGVRHLRVAAAALESARRGAWVEIA